MIVLWLANKPHPIDYQYSTLALESSQSEERLMEDDIQKAVDAGIERVYEDNWRKSVWHEAGVLSRISGSDGMERGEL